MLILAADCMSFGTKLTKTTEDNILMTKSSERAEKLISTNDPETIKATLFQSCACKGALDDEPLCMCKMLHREVGNRISIFALTRLTKIVHHKSKANEVEVE